MMVTGESTPPEARARRRQAQRCKASPPPPRLEDELPATSRRAVSDSCQPRAGLNDSTRVVRELFTLLGELRAALIGDWGAGVE
ncbi:hypothetical protein PRIC1_007485 [Phytophthora ramorum]|nr:hypothetical protein KRP22_7795 [Phytophthora ramorum]